MNEDIKSFKGELEKFIYHADIFTKKIIAEMEKNGKMRLISAYGVNGNSVLQFLTNEGFVIHISINDLDEEEVEDCLEGWRGRK